MKRPLKIAMVSYQRPHLGGSGIMTNELAKALAKDGHQIHTISYPGTYLTESEQGLGMQIHPVSRIDHPSYKAEPFAETFSSQIYQVEKKNGRLDAIHANYATTHGLASLIAKEMIKRERKDGTSPRVIITCHGSDVHKNGSGNLLTPVTEYVLSLADQVTYVSTALKREAEEKFSSLKNKGEVIYNFIDIEKFKKEEEGRGENRYKLGIGIDDIVFYHASNFRPVKDIGLIIDAAEILYEERKLGQIKFLMVGEGPEMANIQERINNKRLKPYFKFTGRSTDVVPFINASDVGLLPSREEAFGLALLETMACEKPVIGSGTGGIPEVIEDGKNGFIFPSGDAEELAEKIVSLSNNKELRKQMGKESLSLVRSKFTSERIVPQYLKLYQKK